MGIIVGVNYGEGRDENIASHNGWDECGGEESHACRFVPHGVEWWDCRRKKESQAGIQISRCTKLLHAMIKAGHSGGNVVSY